MAWTQLDSDILAHFLQVHGQIVKSRWHGAKVSFTTQDGRVIASSFPAFEDFVYAAVYFRQLIAPKDDLFNDAVTRYLRFLDCPVREAWIRAEQAGFNATINGNSFLVLTHYKARDLFDAFIYGAGLMHKSPHLKDAHRARFLELYDNERREEVFYALNTSMRHLLNHVGRVAANIGQDLGHWISHNQLPRPDVRWHDRLFTVPESPAPSR